MKSNVTVELDEGEMENLKLGYDVLTTIETFAKEKDSHGGLFRKLTMDVIVRRKT